ncbi:hypothetical protein [Streptomyces sp. GS7]|uniref:hypothetical protein n=1 Tax=Streptomyces sp. GS7 TaxID=2692234 RepID=UPI001319B0F3|nr:hypothetical protein [Streptomyces sp. GS7]QHC23477.1 hypothetical protein GR130_20930 [Streptomyces sp. GS7]
MNTKHRTITTIGTTALLTLGSIILATPAQAQGPGGLLGGLLGGATGGFLSGLLGGLSDRALKTDVTPVAWNA